MISFYFVILRRKKARYSGGHEISRHDFPRTPKWIPQGPNLGPILFVIFLTAPFFEEYEINHASYPENTAPWQI